LNLGQIRDLAYKLTDTYSSDGIVLPAADTADAKLAMTDFINTAQYKFAERDKIETLYSVTQNPITNLLGDDFNIEQHLDDDIIYEADSAKSYGFEVDHPATVYVEEETATDVWTTLLTLTLTPTSFTEYTGLITASDTANAIRLRFSGSYIYNIRRVALYAYTFASTSDIPQFKPWHEYTLPTGYISTNRIVYNGDDQRRDIYTDYYIDMKKLMVKHDVVGSFDIYYFKQPTALVADDDIPEIQLQFHPYLAYYAAGEWLFSTGSRTPGLVLLNRFDSFLAEMKPNTDGSSNRIENVNNW